ncbi:MAG: hypothetical protein ABWY19_08320 [Marmoricola sp.]
MTSPAQDARPPFLLVKGLNLVLRPTLRSPLGRLVPGVAMLEFRGRRTGRLFRVPVGWHAVEGGHVVVTPARWRSNFRDGCPVTVHARGRRRQMIGRLEDEPEDVAAALRSIAVSRGSLRFLGIRVPDGRELTGDDVRLLDRALLMFGPVPSGEGPG